MLAPPSTAIDRAGLFTTSEALAAGWTPDSLARSVRRGDLIRWRRGVYSPAWHGSPVPPERRPDIDLVRTALAAAITNDTIVVSHLAAASVANWPVWAPRRRACVTVEDNRSRVPGLHVHRTPIGADAALARDDITPERLSQAVAAGAGRTGIAAARALVDLADGRSESPLESRSRWQCVRYGLPPPEPQVCIYDADGHVLGRVDLYWADGVIGEVDGLGKLTDAGARRALLQRQGALARTNLRVTRWGETELRSFGPTAAWIGEELAAAAADPRRRLWRAVST